MSFPPLRRSFAVCAAFVITALSCSSSAAAPISAGVARVDISPTFPVPLMGYAARAKLPMASDVALAIHARALALGEGADTTLLVTIDNCILPAAVTEEVRRRLKVGARLLPDHVTVTVTHTHSAPCLSGAAPNIFGQDMSPEMIAAIDRYTAFLIGKVEEVAKTALGDRKPALLSWGRGSVDFARNRRTPGGPVDHDMPLLIIRSPGGDLRAVWISYACHCTTLGGDLNSVHGDWAGVAAQQVEKSHPGAVVLISVGCGADSNPDPRGTLELVATHGQSIATEAERLLQSNLIGISETPHVELREIQLPYGRPFTAEEWQARSAQPGIVGYHARKWQARIAAGESVPTTLTYPIQTWIFGRELACVFLGGEVVVDYSLRLKRELDPTRIWLNAYSNAVPCYIPSARILTEGGYEAETSLWYYDRPQRLAPEAEDLIVRTVRDMLPKAFESGR